MSALRRVAVFAIPAVLYFAVRPFTKSDAVALAIAGALPLAYQMIVVLFGGRTLERIRELCAAEPAGLATVHRREHRSRLRRIRRRARSLRHPDLGDPARAVRVPA